MKRNYESRSPKVSPEVAVSRFKQIMKDIYKNWDLTLPDQLYLADSAVEAEMGVPGVRVYGGTSDIDILAPEPIDLDQKEIGILEQEIRNSVEESGVDFNFAPKNDLLNGNAYDRVCRPINNFSW
ncbi:MAG: hypothetical protein OEX81_02300 [Candidatus Pacebacteria bacterium]|nr:hypothetical protein [Candidatus Paceibacterota bacterium]